MHTRRAFGAVLLAAPLAALPTDPAELTATEALAVIRQRKLTPAELTEACLKRVEQRNRRLNAFITVMGESALERARVLRPAFAAREPSLIRGQQFTEDNGWREVDPAYGAWGM